jgi:putative ABC transport system permease protein
MDLLKFKEEKSIVENKKDKISRMKISMILFIGYRNLKSGKLRSFLTIGGVAVGIAIITFLICIGFGIQEMTVKEVTKNNRIDIVNISNKNLESFVILSTEIIERLRKIDGVKDVQPIMETGGKIFLGESQTDSIIYGANREYFDLGNVDPFFGTFNGYKNDSNSVVISSQLSDLLGFKDPKEALDKEIESSILLSDEIMPKNEDGTTTEVTSADKMKFKIIGIVNNDKSAFMYAPFDYLYNELKLSGAQSGLINVEVEKINSIRSQVEQMGFVTESIVDMISDINSFFVVVHIVMVILGIIIMSISAMGMLNTLSISLLQRTKEVGILKALGAKRNDIFKMFVFEAAIISVTGGLIGFFGGLLGAKIINVIFNVVAARKGMPTLDFIFVPLGFILTVSGFIVFLGLVTGILPAKRAAKIHALEALRYE